MRFSLISNNIFFSRRYLGQSLVTIVSLTALTIQSIENKNDLLLLYPLAFICISLVLYMTIPGLNKRASYFTLVDDNTNDKEIKLSKSSKPARLFIINPGKFDCIISGGLLYWFEVSRQKLDFGRLANLPAATYAAVATITTLIGLGLLSQQVAFDPKIPPMQYLIYWSVNQLNVCLAEGFIFQVYLPSLIQLVAPNINRAFLSGVIFGTAHYIASPKPSLAYAGLATIAGAGYQATHKHGGIAASVITHGIFNTLHLLCFSYPMKEQNQQPNDAVEKAHID